MSLGHAFRRCTTDEQSERLLNEKKGFTDKQRLSVKPARVDRFAAVRLIPIRLGGVYVPS